MLRHFQPALAIAFVALTSSVVADEATTKKLAEAVEKSGGMVYYDKLDVGRITEVHLTRLNQELAALIIVQKKNLRKLTIADSLVCDEDLQFVTSLINLEVLGVDHAQRVTDAFLKDLSSLPKLSQVWLVGCGIRGSGVAHLKDLPRLKLLDLSLNPIEAKRLTSLERLVALEQLVLGQTAVSDDEIVQVSELKELKTLYLCGTKVTDRGLARLADLKVLKYLFISSPPITNAAIDSFKTARPTVDVVIAPK